MVVYRFDESALVHELKALSHVRQVAFALAAATRQLSNWERLATVCCPDDVQQPRETALRLWAALEVPELGGFAWAGKGDDVMDLLPEQDEAAWVSHALADDALASLAYAIDALAEADAQQAAWAARRAYEAADQAAIRLLDIQTGSTDAEAEAEAAILSHEVVQRELERQHTDLLLLRADSMDEVRHRAFVAELLTVQEAMLASRSTVD